MANILRAVTASAPRRMATSTSRRELSSALLTTTEEFPGIPSTSPEPATASSASVTTLPSGLTVVSENAASTSTISVTFPNAGSSSQNLPSEEGAALVNKYLNFKSGSGLSSLVILRNIENDGASPFATAGRFGATVGYTATKDKALRLMPLLATDCSFEKWDMKDAMQSAKIEAANAAACAETTLTEAIYATAYGAQSSAGATLYSTGASAPSIKSFRERNYGLNGAVLAATGISDHEAFVQAVEEGFSESPVGAPPVPTPASTFIGGEYRTHTPGGKTQLALAFEAPSSASAPLLDVVQQCIAIASEGAVSAITSKGLVALCATSAPADASAVADSICSLVTTPPSADIVQRAKGLAKAHSLFDLEGGSSKVLAGSMTASVLETGSFGAGEVGAAYDAISADDVKGVFVTMAKSNLALAATGDISSVPYQGTLATRFA